MYSVFLVIVLVGLLMAYLKWFKSPSPLTPLPPPLKTSFLMSLFENPRFKKLKIFGDLPVRLDSETLGNDNPFAIPPLPQ